MQLRRMTFLNSGNFKKRAESSESNDYLHSNVKDFSPIKLKPSIKGYLWGGTRLITEYNKETSLEKAAESWELSAHPDGESIVSDGVFKGLTLREYIERNGVSCLGSKCGVKKDFPILIKLIDAKENLSVQVHPDDEYALREKNEYGKTEMWYVIDCEPGAYIYFGLNKKVTKKELMQGINRERLTDLLNKVYVKKGDVFFIFPGTIHAIGSGILICEIQQNSNITYRVYDYGRKDSNGNARELHIKNALDVINLERTEINFENTGKDLVSCKYFTAQKLDFCKTVNLNCDIKSFRSIIVLNGKGNLAVNGKSVDFKKGDSIFVPAQNGSINITGDGEGILTYI